MVQTHPPVGRTQRRFPPRLRDATRFSNGQGYERVERLDLILHQDPALDMDFDVLCGRAAIDDLANGGTERHHGASVIGRYGDYPRDCVEQELGMIHE